MTFFKPCWFFNTDALFESDKFADLDLRTTLAPGTGRQFFESDDLNLSVPYQDTIGQDPCRSLKKAVQGLF